MGSKRYSTRQQKVDWLLAHQELWQGFGESSGNDVCDKFSLVSAMYEAGLISKPSNWRAIPLIDVVNEARRQRRHNALKRVR